MPAVTTAELVKEELSLTAPAENAKLAQSVAAAVSYVARYHREPTEGTAWPADYVLGATKLAANLYRNANAPGVGEAFGVSSDTSFRRATDVQIEQLLRIGRFSRPMVG